MAVSNPIKKLFTRNNKSNRSLANSNRTSLQLETLEARDVPSVTIFQTGETLIVQGTAGDDWIQVEQIGNDAYRSWKITSISEKSGITVQHWNLWNSKSWTPVNRVHIEGNSGNDMLMAGQVRVPVSMNGGSGDDVLWGGSGSDEITGGQGNDFFMGGTGYDTIIEETATDVSIRADPYSFEYTRGKIRFYDIEHITVSATLPGMNPYLLEMFERYGGLDRLPGITVDATDARFGVTLQGGINSDRLYGSQYDDRIEGGGGNNILRGHAGKDALYGGNGDDLLEGESGNDGLYGGAGNDVLNGGKGADRFLILETDRDHTDGNFGRYGEDARITFRNLPEIKQRIDGHERGFRFAAGSWTDEEIQTIDVALANLHHHTGNTRLLKQSDGKELVFSRAGAQLANLTVSIASWNVDGNITFTDSAFQSDYELWSRVYHEIGHNWDNPAENRHVEFFRTRRFWVESSENLSGSGFVASTAYEDNWWYHPGRNADR